MWEDPIVKETREAREALLERFSYDLEALCAYLRQLEEASDKKSITLRPAPSPASARGAS